MSEKKGHPKIFDELAKIAPILPAPLYWTNLNHVLIGANEIAYRLTGGGPHLVGQTPYQYYPFEMADYMLKHNEEVICTGKTLAQKEPIRDITTGETKYLNSIKSPLYDDTGAIIGVVGNFIDITAEKEAERLKQEKFEQQEQFVKICAQVAHDIRSPLAAVEMLTKRAVNMPEKERLLLRHAVTRIHDIANNLIVAYQGKKTEDNILRPYLLSAVLQNLLSEKRLQYQDANVEINADFSMEGMFAFANVELIDFKRVVSNLINNAVEAMPAHWHGIVQVKLHAAHNTLQLIIQDNGKGMPEALIQKLGVEAISSGKDNGCGLGLSHAFKTIEKLQGNIQIHSQLGKGTQIILTLPHHPSPNWFAQELTIPVNGTVIILDDDEAIHYAWDEKLKDCLTQGLTVQHFKEPHSCIDWLTQYQHTIPAVYFLFDYELIGSPLTGLDVIQQFPGVPAVLVTSHFEEPMVINQCELLNVKLLPKNLAAEIRIELKESVMPAQAQPVLEFVLLDNDEFYTEALQMSAGWADKAIKTFNTPEALLADLNNISHDTKIYVDSDLGNGIKGEEFAKELYDRGYQELYLATGYSPKDYDLKQYPWIKEVIGKPMF